MQFSKGKRLPDLWKKLWKSSLVEVGISEKMNDTFLSILKIKTQVKGTH